MSKVLIRAKNAAQGGSGLPMIVIVAARATLAGLPVIIACDCKEIKDAIDSYEFIRL